MSSTTKTPQEVADEKRERDNKRDETMRGLKQTQTD